MGIVYVVHYMEENCHMEYDCGNMSRRKIRFIRGLHVQI